MRCPARACGIRMRPAPRASRSRPGDPTPGLVVFDLDGTLADSAPGIIRALRLTLRDAGITRADAELRGMIGTPLLEKFDSLGLCDGDVAEAVRRFRRYYGEVGLDDAALYEGVPAMLDGLARRGVTLAVATAKRVDFARRMLENLGLEPYFAAVSGASLEGAQTGKVQIVAEVVARLGGHGTRVAWMVGDRRQDVEAAIVHGLVPVGALWGYGSRAELARAGAVWLVKRPLDLVAGWPDGPGSTQAWT